ncbi:Nicastrin-domain-containing protein [Polychytrium aggregatum]|uniref:Nicastrin-domain-containing protein n=1 Tax=Polychytrium aggregatum TaxID=110093 RepID=UPI0022FE3A0F|nr:Nicastrin-domain-containing protein [Polychytrium aggregatum]KAI9192970.1 Nicastrin-domain-containing protein [Polychytrium aggregatum]
MKVLMRAAAALLLLWALSLQTAIAQSADINTLNRAIYQGISVSGCTRILNASGTTGCQTFGAVGVLYMAATQSDVDGFSSNTPAGSYAVVLSYSLLSSQNLLTLRNSGKLAGVILINNGTSAQVAPPLTVSADSTCPGCQFGLYANDGPYYSWNPKGSGLMFQSFDYPIVAIWAHDPGSVQSLGTLVEATASNQASGYAQNPLYYVQFDATMSAAVDAATCLRRGTCDPIGDHSVWSTFSTNITRNDGKGIIVVSSRIDSVSFIHDFSFGADATRAGLVVSMAIADALSKSPTPMYQMAKHVLFTYFDAESWGLSGSEQFLNDISTPFKCLVSNPSATTAACPFTGMNCSQPCFVNTEFQRLDSSKIEAWIEFDQIGNLDQVINDSGPSISSNIYTHINDASDAATLQLESMFLNNPNLPPVSFNKSGQVSVTIQTARSATSNLRLPPSSAMSLLKRRNVPSIVFAAYRDSYPDYFHSEYDNGLAWNRAQVASLCAFANATARNVWTLASGNNTTAPPSVSVNCTLVASLLDCMTRNLSCSTLQPLWANQISGVPTTSSDYASAFQYDQSLQLMPYMINQFMFNITATSRISNCSTSQDCSYANGYQCIANSCIMSRTHYHYAYSPGIAKDPNSGLWVVADATKPTWTESRWNNIRIRVFKSSSLAYQWIELVVGVVLTAVTVAATLWARKLVNKHFKTD